MTEYAGESLAKKVARVRLYTRVREALQFAGRDLNDVKVLFLPGPDACEVGALKHILKTRPENVVGVDIDGDACKVLTDRWPKANVVKGDLKKAKTFRYSLEDITMNGSKEFDGFDFIHLDLMGNLRGDSEFVYGNWGRLCAENGVMAVTYLRGREHPTKVKPNVKKVRDTAKMQVSMMEHATGEAKKLKKILAPDPERALSHLLAINQGYHKMLLIDEADGDVDAAIDNYTDFVKEAERRIKKSGVRGMLEYRAEMEQLHFTALASYSYRADTSPMGVLATQLVSIDTLESDSYAILRYKNGRHTSSVIKKDPMEDLVAEADLLAIHYGKQEAAEILHVSTGTLAAWRAHLTRGTYTT
jgi:hypothetical protein